MKDTIIIFFLAKETFDEREKLIFFKTDKENKEETVRDKGREEKR